MLIFRWRYAYAIIIFLLLYFSRAATPPLLPRMMMPFYTLLRYYYLRLHYLPLRYRWLLLRHTIRCADVIIDFLRRLYARLRYAVC